MIGAYCGAAANIANGDLSYDSAGRIIAGALATAALDAEFSTATVMTAAAAGFGPRGGATISSELLGAQSGDRGGPGF